MWMEQPVNYLRHYPGVHVKVLRKPRKN